MRILITGAAGFVGQLLAKALLDDEQGRYSVVLTDIVEPPVPANAKWPQQAKSVKADLLTEAAKVVDEGLDAVFVFHGIMSAGAEADFELGKPTSPFFCYSTLLLSLSTGLLSCKMFVC